MSPAKPLTEHASGDSLPLFTRHQRLELRQFSRPHRDRSSSCTLAELLNCVDEASFSSTPAAASCHFIHEMTTPSSSSTSFYSSGLLVPTTLPSFLLSFDNLSYSINVQGKLSLPAFLPLRNRVTLAGSESPPQHQLGTKVLLNDISGEAREGELMAVLGASGSGKSTLIDALANRISKDSLKGTVTLNGQALDSRLLKVISAYVMQDDLLFPMLTVHETIMFSAEFRLPCSLSKSRKKACIQALLDQLGLRSATNTVIGDEGHQGVSGGERRRVSIGIDIIHARSSCSLMSRHPALTQPAPSWSSRFYNGLHRVAAL